MFQIIVEKECGCFRRSDMQNNIEVASKDEALTKALDMVNTMNGEFCQKHSFKLEEAGNAFVIKMD
ncbi:hypothetical protein [Sulfurimonas sp.]